MQARFNTRVNLDLRSSDKKHLNLLWLYNTLRGWAILVAVSLLIYLQGQACIHLHIKLQPFPS
jgi:hypothetical protein